MFLENGANVNVETYGQRPALPVAAQNGHEAVAPLLLGNGADVDTTTYSKRTVPYGAAEHGHEALVRLLLEKGTDINAEACGGSFKNVQAELSLLDIA